ncbi:MAG: hypothetical protein IJ917_03540 [Firmicutes bacterium]|nr:hypothetical protein [Bacillota bacterium]
MIQAMRKVPVTESSYPFISAVKPCDLEKHGYVEEEFFQTGTANIYDETLDGKLTITVPDVPYTTRLLVRRPVDPQKFNGNVILEILNASANFDIDRDWILMWRKIVRDGDIYIGITSKGHVVDALKRFDPERYAAINWANPTPERKGPEGPDFDFMQPYELGLFWDMLVDLAKVLRHDDDPLNPIAGFGKNWLFLAGWSQSGSYLSRIINTFARLPENRVDGPLFDGYYNSGSGAGNKKLNSYAPGGRMVFGGLPQGAQVLVSKEPVMAVNTESENRGFGFWHGDADEPDYRFRTWQIPCSSHDTKYSLLDYYAPIQEDLAKAGVVLTWEGDPKNGVPMDTPYEPIFCAAMKALIDWARFGIPAPHAPKIETEVTPEPTDKTGQCIANRKDAFGNALGGIRYPTADCPTASYQSYTDHPEGGSIQMMFGTAKPFSAAMLTELYGNLAHYKELAVASTDRAIAQGFILPEDREWMIDAATEIASSRGLE